MRRQVGEHPLVNPPDRFAATLTSWQAPSFLAPLGHAVGPGEPGGVIDGFASPGPLRPVAHTDATPMPVVARRRDHGIRSALSRAVQRIRYADAPDQSTVDIEDPQQVPDIGTAASEDPSPLAPTSPAPVAAVPVVPVAPTPVQRHPDLVAAATVVPPLRLVPVAAEAPARSAELPVGSGAPAAAPQPSATPQPPAVPGGDGVWATLVPPVDPPALSVSRTSRVPPAPATRPPFPQRLGLGAPIVPDTVDGLPSTGRSAPPGGEPPRVQRAPSGAAAQPPVAGETPTPVPGPVVAGARIAPEPTIQRMPATADEASPVGPDRPRGEAPVAGGPRGSDESRPAVRPLLDIMRAASEFSDSGGVEPGDPPASPLLAQRHLDDADDGSVDSLLDAPRGPAEPPLGVSALPDGMWAHAGHATLAVRRHDPDTPAMNSLPVSRTTVQPPQDTAPVIGAGAGEDAVWRDIDRADTVVPTLGEAPASATPVHDREATPASTGGRSVAVSRSTAPPVDGAEPGSSGITPTIGRRAKPLIQTAPGREYGATAQRLSTVPGAELDRSRPRDGNGGRPGTGAAVHPPAPRTAPAWPGGHTGSTVEQAPRTSLVLAAVPRPVPAATTTVARTVTATAQREPEPADPTGPAVTEGGSPAVPASVAGTALADGSGIAPGAAPGAPARGADLEPEELLKKIIDPLLRRLKAELRVDRDRQGLVTDLRS